MAPKTFQDNAISVKVACDVCNAAVGEPCSAPNNFSRRPVKWFHSSRTTEAMKREASGG